MDRSILKSELNGVELEKIEENIKGLNEDRYSSKRKSNQRDTKISRKL